MHIDGTSADHIAVSDTTTTSHSSRLAMLGEQRLEVGAAHLFLALDQQLQVHRQRAVAREQRPDRLEVVEDLALVVDRATGEELTVALGGFERRR